VPPTANEQWMCKNQLVQSDGYASFSVLGIALILIIGELIIIAQLLLNPLANTYRRRMNHGVSTTMPACNAANVLQIQRLAFEGLGVHTGWEMSSAEDMIPVTDKGSNVEFNALHRQAAPGPEVSKELKRGKRYNMLQQTSSSQASQQSFMHRMASHADRSISFSRPINYQRSVSDNQEAIVMEVEQGYRFDQR
jgi:hypothetical protein